MTGERRERQPVFPDPAADASRSRSTIAIVILVVLAIRGAQLFAIWVGSSAQSSSGPATPTGVPFDYYVFSPSGESPNLTATLGNWDGQWYQRIATDGYPRAEDVRSGNDSWAAAFPPLFPALVRVVMEVSALPFAWAAFAVNTVAVLVATWFMFDLVARASGSLLMASGAAVGISLLPSAPVLVVAYSEAVALMFLLGSLRLMLQRRYLLASILVVLLAMTRPIALPLVVVVGVHAASRFRSGSRPKRREGVALAVLAAVAGMSPWLWPKLSAVLFGTPDVTQFVGATRTDQIASGLWSGYFGTAWSLGGTGPLLLLVFLVVVMLGALGLVCHKVSWPVELTTWGIFYLLMVLMVTPVTPGFLRYLMLAAPLLVVAYAAPLRNPRLGRLIALGVIAALSIAAQWFWIRYLYVLDPAPALYPWAP